MLLVSIPSLFLTKPPDVCKVKSIKLLSPSLYKNPDKLSYNVSNKSLSSTLIKLNSGKTALLCVPPCINTILYFDSSKSKNCSPVTTALEVGANIFSKS